MEPLSKDCYRGYNLRFSLTIIFNYIISCNFNLTYQGNIGLILAFRRRIRDRVVYSCHHLFRKCYLEVYLSLIMFQMVLIFLIYRVGIVKQLCGIFLEIGPFHVYLLTFINTCSFRTNDIVTVMTLVNILFGRFRYFLATFKG